MKKIRYGVAMSLDGRVPQARFWDLGLHLRFEVYALTVSATTCNRRSIAQPIVITPFSKHWSYLPASAGLGEDASGLVMSSR